MRKTYFSSWSIDSKNNSCNFSLVFSLHFKCHSLLVYMFFCFIVLHIYLCVMCLSVYVFAYVWAYTCVCMVVYMSSCGCGGPKLRSSGYLPGSHSTLFIEAASLSWTQEFTYYLVWHALGILCLCLPVLELEASHHALSEFMEVLGIWPLVLILVQQMLYWLTHLAKLRMVFDGKYFHFSFSSI